MLAIDIFFCYRNYGIRLKLENLKPKGQTIIRSEKNTHCPQWHSSNMYKRTEQKKIKIKTQK